MYRCFSFGASTLVAFMAVHRAGLDADETICAAFNHGADGMISGELYRMAQSTDAQATWCGGMLIAED